LIASVTAIVASLIVILSDVLKVVVCSMFDCLTFSLCELSK